uniref:Uncharacterized protein n=1 Tax=Anguilla anguilla TaxID=7936 RepID=A0A0E9V0P9_ANGAN
MARVCNVCHFHHFYLRRRAFLLHKWVSAEQARQSSLNGPFRGDTCHSIIQSQPRDFWAFQFFFFFSCLTVKMDSFEP